MIIREVSFVGGAVAPSGMPARGLPEFAFAGRSNVGKSSLINMLLRRKKLARTSRTPGKTQEVNFFVVNETFYVVDLPGFGYSRVAKSQRKKWQIAIGRYVTLRDPLRMVFQLIDARHPPTPLDRELMLLLKESPAAHVVLLTKGDKLSGNERGKAVRNAENALAEIHLELPVILTSAKDGRGRDDVLGWIESFLR